MTIQVHETEMSALFDRKGEYLRLETIGRKSRRPHQVLLRFVTLDDRIIVFPQTSRRQEWVLNLQANPEVKVYTGSGVFAGRANLRLLAGLNDPVLGIFARKYGMQTARERYWGLRSIVEIQVTRAETGNLAELVYDDLEAAFDGVAEDYDRHIFGNPINTWLRNISVTTLKQHYPPGSTVLEVGCGTGTETLSLARNGVTVLACDVSKRMLNVLERKAVREDLQDRVITVQCREDSLREKVRALGYDKIDGAYSTYGAINTEPRLHQLFQDIHDLLKPGGTLILGVWNKFCLYETVGYILRGKPRLAFARLRNPVPMGRSRFCVKSNAYSVGTLSKHLDTLFKLQSVFGVVITLPPSNLTRYLPRGRTLPLAKKLDLQLGRVFPFNRLGDHFLAVYTSRPNSQ